MLPASAVVVISPTHGSLANNGDGTFGYMPAPNYYGADSFTYSICDVADLCAIAPVAMDGHW